MVLWMRSAWDGALDEVSLNGALDEVSLGWCFG